MRPVAAGLGGLVVAFLLLPVVGVVLGTSLDDLQRAWAMASTRAAVGLSLWTSLLAMFGVVVGGTPLAWWLSRDARGTPWARLAVELPIVLPPAVMGVALLQTFGRQGLVGSWLEAAGVGLSFSSGAVVLAQALVGAPLFVLSAEAAFRKVDPDMVLVARTLGASPVTTFTRVVVPMAWPGLMVGVGLAWARALGEFGATLMFAGSLPGRTQTVPLAIYAALDSDPGVAQALSALLVVGALVLLVGLRRTVR